MIHLLDFIGMNRNGFFIFLSIYMIHVYRKHTFNFLRANIQLGLPSIALMNPTNFISVLFLRRQFAFSIVMLQMYLKSYVGL